MLKVIFISPATWGHTFLVAPATWLYFRTSVRYIYFVSCFGLSLGHVLHFRSFAITLRHTTIGRTPLDDWSAWRSGLYLTTHNTYKRQTSMPEVGFEPTIPGSELPKTHALDRIDTEFFTCQFYFSCKFWPSSICTLSSELGPQFYFSLGPWFFSSVGCVNKLFYGIFLSVREYFCLLFWNISLIGATTDSLYISINL